MIRFKTREQYNRFINNAEYDLTIKNIPRVKIYTKNELIAEYRKNYRAKTIVLFGISRKRQSSEFNKLFRI